MKLNQEPSTPTFHELWEVSQAAAKLTNHACAISARHLKDGITRSIFNREVAYYARSIVRDVEQGKKTIAQGLMEIKTEQRSLSHQSREIALRGLESLLALCKSQQVQVFATPQLGHFALSQGCH